MSTNTGVDVSDDRGHHVAKTRQQELEDQQRRSLKQWTDLGHAAIADEDWERLHAILDSKLAPRVNTTTRGVRIAQRRSKEAGLPFSRSALRMWLKSRDGQTLVSVTPGVDPEETTLHDVEIEVEQVPVDPRTLTQAFRSIYTMLGLAGVADTDAKSAVPAYEYRHQVGERYYSALSPGSRDARLIDPKGDLKATLFTGGQGSGKSTAMETVVEDRIDRGHKVIDLMDFVKAENAMYDVPPRDVALQRARAEMGLDVGFQEYAPPKVEIRVPLTHELGEMQVPFDTDRDDYVVKPFCIAASDLSYRQLVMILPHTTKTHENYLQSAHQILDQRGDDWSLADCAEVVREETNAGDSVADRIERSLKTAQNKSFVRDEKVPDELKLDWDSMMKDTDTVTTFTMFSLSEKSDRLLIASYLLDRLYDARRRLLRSYNLHEYPPLTCVMRELHQIVPRSKSEQDAEKTIEGYMIDTMGELIALVRHANMELLCDTQKFKQQLSSDVSGLFHRIFAFGGQKPDIKKVFHTRVDDSGPAEKVAQFETGKCALVSGDGYTMPIQMAPPRCHHLDAKSDGNGLGFRVRHPMLPEEWRDAPWETDIPERLQFDDTPDSPIFEFWNKFIKESDDPGAVLLKEDVTEAYSKWAELKDKDPKTHRDLHTYISRHIGPDAGNTRKHDDPDRTSVPCYKALKCTF